MNLTKLDLIKCLIYCPETGEFSWLINKGTKVKRGDLAGRKITNKRSKKSYLVVSLNSKAYLAHRLAFLYMTGKFPVDQVDHINGNGIDNRWVNLRPASSKENGMNRRLNKRNKSGFVGVSWDTEFCKWRSDIRVNGKTKFLGKFKNKQDAILARKEANIKYGYHSNHGKSRPL